MLKKSKTRRGNARRGGKNREAAFRILMTRLRARTSLNAEEIQKLADSLSKLWRERNHLYTNRLAKAAKMLKGMIDADELEVASTGDATTAANAQMASTGDATTQTKENKEISPHTPYIETKETNKTTTRARECEFIEPTVAEVAAHIREKGYSFDAKHFWNYYHNNDWSIGNRTMKSWKSACVSWQAKEDREAKRLAAPIDRKTAEAERLNEAERVRKAKLRESAVAALTERDWELCAESCANCTGRSCLKNHSLPCCHRLNARPVPPSDCPHFAAKEGGRA